MCEQPKDYLCEIDPSQMTVAFVSGQEGSYCISKAYTIGSERIAITQGDLNKLMHLDGTMEDIQMNIIRILYGI